MTTNIVVGDITDKQNEIMYDLMQPEAAGLEEIFEDPKYKIKEAYDELRGEHMEVEDALGFTYLIKDEMEYDIMEALNKLYKSGLSLSKIKKAQEDWQTEFYTDIWSEGLEEYKEYIITKRERINGANTETHVKNKRLGVLGEIEKRMNFHMKWGFTMSVFKKFEAPFSSAVTKIQTRRRGNKTRSMLEDKGIWYQDATSHWKKKNKNKVAASLLKEFREMGMIDDTLPISKKAKKMEGIKLFMKEKGFVKDMMEISAPSLLNELKTDIMLKPEVDKLKEDIRVFRMDYAPNPDEASRHRKLTKGSKRGVEGVEGVEGEGDRSGKRQAKGFSSSKKTKKKKKKKKKQSKKQSKKNK